jgi:putative transposase
MNPSITLRPGERNALLELYRSRFNDPELRLRAHILLLLADGHTWATIAAVLYCSTRTIARWRDRFEHRRLDALLGNAPGPKPHFADGWADLVADWVLLRTPRAFGWLRSRWCCALLAMTLWRVCRLQVSRETVRRWLHERNLVWRRPRPVLRRIDPQREEILAKLRALLRDLPDDETVVFEDEVDVNLNPEIGLMWMRRGEQAEVVTPGDNEKNYLAGSLHWRTGSLLAPVVGPKRNGTLVAAHLDGLGGGLRRYRKVHVFCDNAKTHKCAAVNKVLKAHRGRLVLHYLPRYAPECNPVERVWWHLREEITRNHQCRNLEELIELVFAWLEGRKRFPVEDSVYRDEEPASQETNAA